MTRHSPSVMVIALDGAVPSYIDTGLERLPLPSFASLKRRGVWFTDCRPAFPSITPTCWSSFATGATPATHGAVDQDYHPPGSPDPLALVSAYHGSEIRAERFWEAAARAGKRSLVLQMPASGPRRSDRVLQVGGTGCAAIGGAAPGRPTVPAQFEVPAVLFRSGGPGRSPRSVGVLSPASGQWNPDEPDRMEGANAAHGSVEIVVDTEGSATGVAPFSWFCFPEGGGVAISETPRRSDAVATLSAGSWSPPLLRTLRTTSGDREYRYRVKLLEADGDGVSVYFTPMGDLGRSCEPSEFASRIARIDEVPAHTGSTPLLYEGDAASYLEAEAWSLSWQRKVIAEALERDRPEIVVTYAVFLDSMNHRYRNDVEGISEASRGEREAAVDAYERAYRLADEHLGELLALCDDQTEIVVVSDHGSVGYTSVFSPERCLEEAGLLGYRDESAPGSTSETPSASKRREIDWSVTRAYPIGTCFAQVNLRGRESTGIVSQSDYGRVVQETIAALKRATGSGGVSPVAFAVPRDQAGLVGLGGERCGDVVYGLAGSYVGGHVGGVHACQIPTAKTATGDVRSLLILAGPSFKRGVTTARPAALWDIAPTICHVRHYPPPAQAEGAVLQQAIVE